MNNKDDIRRRIRARKQLVDDTERREAARRVFDRVRRMAAFVVAERVLLYHSLPDELSTIAFMERFVNNGNDQPATVIQKCTEHTIIGVLTILLLIVLY